MEGNAVTYEKIVLNGYKIEHILSLEILENPNGHGRLRLKAVISEDLAEQYVYTTAPMMPVTLGYQGDGDSRETLFRGTVANIQIECQGSTYHMDLEVKGKTCIMDIIERSRSFQKSSMTVHQLFEEVLSEYGEHDCIIQIPDVPIKRLIVQYRETDWDFLKRFASRYGAVLIPDVESEKIALYVGVPEQAESHVVSSCQYNIAKKMDEYLRMKKNRWKDALEVDFTVFQVWEYRIFRVGDEVVFNNADLTVQSARRILQDGVLKNQYELVRKNGLRGLELYNEKLVGVSLTGSVTKVSRDKVMVQLKIDKPGRAACWLPYSTMSASPDGSGWYCMPEKGDQVRVYFPTNQESEAYAVSAVSGHEPKQGDTEDLMANPDVKYLRTKAGQVIQFAEEGIILNSGDGEATIFLGNSGELAVYGSKDVSVTAKNTLSLISNGQLVVGAVESVCMKKGEDTSITLEKEGKIRMIGTKIFSN